MTTKKTTRASKSATTSISSRLANSIKSKMPVRFERVIDDGFVDGFILDVGRRFFLMSILDVGYRLDGYECLRIADVRALQSPHRYADMINAAMKKRRERMSRKPRIDVTSMQSILTTAAKLFPLITIHREIANPNACEVGKVKSITSGTLSMLEINPDASWESKPTKFRLSEITRVDLGDSYADAMHLAGGEPP